MSIKRSALALLLCLACMLSFSACGQPAGERYAALAQAAYEGDISWEMNGTAYAGRLSLSAGEALAQRRLLLVYTAPAALCGICVYAEGEELTLSRNGITHALNRTQEMGVLPFLRFFDADTVQGVREHEDGALCFSDGEGDYVIRMEENVCMYFSSPTCSLTVTLEGAA